MRSLMFSSTENGRLPDSLLLEFDRHPGAAPRTRWKGRLHPGIAVESLVLLPGLS